jgi:hypothetical protein
MCSQADADAPEKAEPGPATGGPQEGRETVVEEAVRRLGRGVKEDK